MTNTRIVLSQKYKPLADELLTVTGIDSLSNLFVIFLTRYGSHLRMSWNVLQPGMGQTFVSAPVAHSVTPISVVESQIHHQSEQITPDPEPEEIDPVIARIAGLVDRF